MMGVVRDDFDAVVARGGVGGDVGGGGWGGVAVVERTRGAVGVGLVTAGVGSELGARVDVALASGVAALFGKLRDGRWGSGGGRDEDPLTAGGHWCAELEGDSILSSEYVLMKWILGQEGDEPAGDPRRLSRLCDHMRLHQRGDGTWGQYPGSPADISATVKAYFCLKLDGDDVGAAHMVRAREAVLGMGGAERINTFSMFYLACLGQVSWEACPAIPVEVSLLPRWFPFHLDKVAAWTRTMILPLAICSALRPVRELPEGMGIGELFVDQGARGRLNQSWDRDEVLGWKNTFLAVDRVLKLMQRLGVTPLRGRAIKKAERWILERVEPGTTEGLGAIFPPMVYLQVAFAALDYGRDHPVIRQAEADLDDFVIDAGSDDERLDHVRIQPCFSPVWDTGIALYAMTEAGLTARDDARLVRVCDWLVNRQVKMTGDWVRNFREEHRGMVMGGVEAERAHPGKGASAWAFEYRNEWYPDADDTAMIAKALWRAGSIGGSDSLGKGGVGKEGGEVPGNEFPGLCGFARDGVDACGAGVGLGEKCAVYRETARLACRWLVAMQNDDGGWAAFDRTRDRGWMEAVPFADHNAMQDPSCPDITGRVIEALVTCGMRRDDRVISDAVSYMLRTQMEAGWWRGRWGVNGLYGTWQALGGMTHAGVDRGHASMVRAREWLLGVQNADGGFGESANSYFDDGLVGRGVSSASQTAWGLMCLLYVVRRGERGWAEAERAAGWLCDMQLEEDKGPYEAARTVGGGKVWDGGVDPTGVDVGAGAVSPMSRMDHVHDVRGGWCEHVFTGTGFPKVFYLRYHLYRHYFPVMALGRYRNVADGVCVGGA